MVSLLSEVSESGLYVKFCTMPWSAVHGGLHANTRHIASASNILQFYDAGSA